MKDRIDGNVSRKIHFDRQRELLDVESSERGTQGERVGVKRILSKFGSIGEDPLYTVDRLTPPGRERLPDIVAHEPSATVVVRRRQRRVVMSQITRRRDRRSEAFEQRGPAIRWNWIHLGGL